MLTANQTRARLATIALLFLPLGAGSVMAGEPPRVQELRTQKVGDTTYFHVRLGAPPDLRTVPVNSATIWSESARRALARIPKLVAQDGKTRSVYSLRQETGTFPLPIQAPEVFVPATGLEFVGQLVGQGQAKFLLVYLSESEVPATDKTKNKRAEPAKPVRRRSWVEVLVTLDFGTAQDVAVPDSARERKPNRPPEPNDLEGLWAVGQAGFFALLEAQTPDFGFYPFAREATNRKYGIQVPSLGQPIHGRHHPIRLYETTTGAAAIAESLQMERLLNTRARDNEAPTVDITKVQGIDIAEHPWTRMMAGKKPSPEPLAKLVPDDNYYIHFKSVRKFIEFGELLDQWGTNLVRTYEVTSRDYRIKERYEKQICIKSTWMGKTLGPAVIRSLAITGSDGYLREGSDVTVIFQVVNRKLFLAAVEPFVQEARKEFAGRLKEAKEDYSGTTVTSLVTPRREVSLHRAAFDDFVVYSNSPAGLRRVIDTFQGRHKALADALDFQYMRTVFRLEDEKEDGFAFLSDPFIRQLVGPASKIKEKRRLEGLTSLYMVNYGALFSAWENGKPAAKQEALLASAKLRPEQIYAPGGKEATWDVEQQTAVSDVYNTIQFATPLIELPIDRITPTEERDYQQFRTMYLRLWRGYFDPIAMRVSLKDEQVRLDTYILPLIQSWEYNQLRMRTGGGTTKLDPSDFAPQALVQFVSHISADAPERLQLAGLLGQLGALGRAKGLDWLGDWFVIRLDDSPVYAKLAEWKLRDEPSWVRNDVDDRLLFQIPATLGVGIRNPLLFAGVLTALRTAAVTALPDGLEWAPMDPKYKDITIVRVKAKPNSDLLRRFPGSEDSQEKEPFAPALYYMTLDGGWYVSLQETCLKDLIDRSVARRQSREAARKGELVEVNNSLYLAPAAATKAKDFLRAYLEWESHRHALTNAPVFYALYRCGLLDERTPQKTRENTSMSYLGFVPVSPEGAAYVYDPKTDEVVNQRHGSPRRPQLHRGVEENSPLGRLLGQLRTVRADLRFREDGINTVVTIERTKRSK